MPDNFHQLLESAARACGIENGFWDIWGNYHATPPEVTQAILESLGMDAGTEGDLQRSLMDRSRREWERLVAPSVVASESRPRILAVQVPSDSLGQQVQINVQREDGSTASFAVTLSELPDGGSADLDGRTWIRKQVRLPDDLPLGYHDVTVSLGSVTATTRYIVTPDHAWKGTDTGGSGRVAGVAVSLYGVRSERNWGCGDFRDLLAVIDWVADTFQASFLSLNPLHAIHNRHPFNTSPYSPNSIFYQNFLYLDVEGIEDFSRCRRARHLRHRRDVCGEIETLRAAPLVDYERTGVLKLRFLKLLFVQFLREWRTGSPRAREFEAFRSREGDLLEQFATYCALDEFLHRQNPEVWNWPQWPPEYQDPDGPATEAFRKRHWRAVMFYQYLQWQIDRQLDFAQQYARRRLSIGLYHDLALATDSVGSDLWAQRQFFAPGCRVGSPPDDFAPKGQDWGFPPPNSERHREDGYRHFAESIRKNCRHGGALRIDHVMRLFRLYWIPDGYDAGQGAYVRELSDDYLRLLALESVRNRVIIVGEDLGTVEPAIRETLSRFGILSYRVFYFEKYDGTFRRPDEYPAQALVSSTTHDLPTLTGYWANADIEARRQAGTIDEEGYRTQLSARAQDKQKMVDALFQAHLLPEHLPRSASDYGTLTGELRHAIAGFLALTRSQLWSINQEDITGEPDQQNLPGTTWQYPNWRRKMRFSIERLRSDPEAQSLAATFREWIAESGRTNR